MKPFFTPFLVLLPTASLLLATGLRAQSAPPEPPPISLSTLVNEIAAKNPELNFYTAEIAAVKAGGRHAGVLADPEISLSAGHKRVRDLTGAFVGEGTAWSVSVTQTFEWPGRLALRKSIANRQTELAELGLARFRAALTARAQTLAFGLHAANVKHAAVLEVAARFATLKETFLAREPAGITPLLETRVIEASELALQRRATDAGLALHSALLELNQLRGAVTDAPLRVTAPALKFNDPPSADTLLGAARENNFDFKMRRVELEQQGFVVRLAQNERYPAISVSPFYSRESAGDRESILGLGISVPLAVSNRARAGVEVAEARRRQAETAIQLAERELDKEVQTAAQTFTAKVAEMRRWSPDTVEKFREAAELADRHYRLGAVPVATYVELQHGYLEAIESLLDTQREALTAGLKLQQLTGLDFSAVVLAP